MGTKQSHIINKVFVEVETNSSTKAHDIRRNSSEFINSSVLNIVEDYLETVEKSFEDVTVQIEPIALNVTYEQGTIGSLNLKEQITKQLDEIFKPIVRTVSEKKATGSSATYTITRDSSTPVNPNDAIAFLTKEAKDLKTILHFIETGRAPWWIQKHATLREMLETSNVMNLLESKTSRFVSKLVQITKSDTVRKRITQQFSTEINAIIIEAFISENKRISSVPNSQEAKNELIRFTESILKSEKQLFLEKMLFIAQEKTIQKSDVQEIAKVFSKAEDRHSALTLCLNLLGESNRSVFENEIATTLNTSEASQATENSDVEESSTNSKTGESLSQSADKTVDSKQSKDEKQNAQFRSEKDAKKANDKSVSSDSIMKTDQKASQPDSTSNTVNNSDENQTSQEQPTKESPENFSNSDDPTLQAASQESKKPNGSNESSESKTFSQERLQKNKTRQHKSVSEENHSRSAQRQQEDSILTENAGLVILQPFLKPFFTKLGLLSEENELIDPALSAHILHYLATGIEEDYEFAMIIEAYLCGLPIDEPIPRSVPLSDAIKNDCNDLLLAVLKHWTALKSSSIPLLQNEFLQRDGKLILNEESPRVVIERKTIDILLDKIPWTISIMKIPWKDKLMYVEW